jgi:hypothetical protein
MISKSQRGERKMRDLPEIFSIVEGQIISKAITRIKEGHYGFSCGICGHFGFRKEMRDDWDLGWVHWGCGVNLEKDRISDKRFEYEMDQVKGEEI